MKPFALETTTSEPGGMGGIWNLSGFRLRERASEMVLSRLNSCGGSSAATVSLNDMASLPPENRFTVQAVTCSYPISDLYASAPRYLYYSLLVLRFITLRHSWLAHIFLGGVVAYAATAAIEAFVLIAAAVHPDQRNLYRSFHSP